MNELFELNTPDCVSSLGKKPINQSVNYFPAKITEQSIEKYDNPWCKWEGRGAVGVFKDTVNLVSDPEDMTTSNWGVGGTITRTLSNKYFGSRRFTKLTAGTASSNISCSAIAFGSTGVKSFSIIVKKSDTAAVPRVGLYNSLDGYDPHLEINWGAKTVTIVTGTGTIVKTNWYGDDIVEILCQTDSLAKTSPNYLYMRPDENSTNSTYFTAAQVEDSTYPTPYTITSRSAGKLIYPKSLTNAGTIECWVRPWFPYTTSTTHMIFNWGPDTTHRLTFYYFTSDNNWRLSWCNGGTSRTVNMGTSYTDNDDLQKWIHLKVVWDIGLELGGIYVNGTLDGNTWNGTLDTYTDGLSPLGIGLRWQSSDLQLNGLITDFSVKDYVDTSDDHYRKNKPYYTKNKIIGKNCNWKMS